MKDITFITGNHNKADFLARWLGIPIKHQSLDLLELQSMDLHEIVRHKAMQAYHYIQKPVLVEDVSLTFHALGRLPGPFIKWFLQELSLHRLCDLLPVGTDRSATSEVSYAYYDGKDMHLFDGAVSGSIALHPRGEHGFGFDPIFIPQGSEYTHAEMTDEQVAAFGLRTTTVYPKLREFFVNFDK